MKLMPMAVTRLSRLCLEASVERKRLIIVSELKWEWKERVINKALWQPNARISFTAAFCLARKGSSSHWKENIELGDDDDDDDRSGNGNSCRSSFNSSSLRDWSSSLLYFIFFFVQKILFSSAPYLTIALFSFHSILLYAAGKAYIAMREGVY